MKTALKSLLFTVPGARRCWTSVRSGQLLRAYRQRREYYERLCAQHRQFYSESNTQRDVRNRLTGRGYTVSPKAMGAIHTLAIVPNIFWHAELLDDLRELGPTTVCDYTQHGYAWHELAPTERGRRRHREMNARVLPFVIETQRERPIDWVFVYESGREISPSTIHAMHEEIGVPVVGMCLDDKHCWAGPSMGGHRAGQIDLARHFDVSWTSARVACGWYLAEGGRPLYMPPGCNARTYSPTHAPRNLEVSFIGAAYGFRFAVIDYLGRHGIKVAAYGDGWNNGFVSTSEAVSVICRSHINLGMGGIGYCESLTNVKGRDFEIPCAGGGVYITSYNPDLATHFRVGEEIVCYRNRDEMLELIRHHLSHPEEAAEISDKARHRSIHEHRWLHRYQRICRLLGILPTHDDA
jgi:spore maturation protein CgeB